MEWTPERTVVAATPTSHGFLILEWDEGTRFAFDAWAHISDTDGFLTSLRDPDYFDLVRISPGGITVGWPNGEDFAPESLWAETIALPSDSSTANWQNDFGTPTAKRSTPSRAMRLTGVTPLQDGFIEVAWSDGTHQGFDAWGHAEDQIERLADFDYFRLARINSDGTAIEWPNGEAFTAQFVAERASR